jgi:DNA-directed RNA polymerase alpha subunit
VGDWVLLYHVSTEQGGKTEHDARRKLERYRVLRMYLKDGQRQKGRELVNCGFTTALEALTSCLSESELKSAWRSSRTYEFEFDRPVPDPFLLERRSPRPPIGMPEGALFLMPVDELEVSVLAANRLKLAGIDLVGTLIQKSEVELLSAAVIGSKALSQVREALSQVGLHLGMEVPNWPPADLDRLAVQAAPMLRRVDDLELSVRTINCLRNEGFFYLGELVQKSEAELLRMSNFGRKSLNEIKEVLAKLDLHLGMELRGWRSNPNEARSVHAQTPVETRVLLQIVDELEFSVRTAICLRNDNIVYIGQLIQKSEAEMLRTPNFGRKSLNEVKEVLAQMGLHLGMDIPSWPQMLAAAGLAEDE